MREGAEEAVLVPCAGGSQGTGEGVWAERGARLDLGRLLRLKGNETKATWR